MSTKNYTERVRSIDSKAAAIGGLKVLGAGAIIFSVVLGYTLAMVIAMELFIRWGMTTPEFELVFTFIAQLPVFIGLVWAADTVVWLASGRSRSLGRTELALIAAGVYTLAFPILYTLGGGF